MSLDARRRANGRRCADVRLVVVVHHGRLPRLVGVIHRRARVKEEYRRRVSPVADAVVDSVVEVPAGFLEVLAARETHQRAVRDGEPAQQRALGDVHSRPPADARDRGRPELGGKVRMERRSFRGPAPRSRHRRERARRGGAKGRRSARERREGAAHDKRTAASSCATTRRLLRVAVLQRSLRPSHQDVNLQFRSRFEYERAGWSILRQERSNN